MSEQELAAEMYVTRSSLKSNQRYEMDWKSIIFWSKFVAGLYK